MNEDCCMNTDVEIWRERPDDYYASSIHVTQDGRIGIDVGGTVYVKSVKEWHDLANLERIVTPMFA